MPETSLRHLCASTSRRVGVWGRAPTKANLHHYHSKYMRTKESVVTKIYNHVVSELFLGNLEFGQAIVRKELAEKLKVSRGAVLLAMNKLASDGFIDIAPRKSTCIKAFSQEAVCANLLIRESLECCAVQIYSGKLLENAYEDLLALATKIDAAGADSIERMHMDIQFHIKLMSLVGNEYFIAECQRVLQVSLFLKITKALPRGKQVKNNPHVQLLKVLRKGNIAKSQDAVRTHIRTGREDIFDTLTP